MSIKKPTTLLTRNALIAFAVFVSVPYLVFWVKARPDALAKAIYRGDTQEVTNLLKVEGKVNRRYMSNVTPLAVAVAQGKVEVARILLDAGANPNVMDTFGLSIWMQASAVKDPADKIAMVKLLLEHGCKPHGPLRSGEPNPFSNPPRTPNSVPPHPILQHDEGKDQR